MILKDKHLKMELPKLTQHQLEEMARRAEACLVHPYNVNRIAMRIDQIVQLEDDYEKTVDNFREFATPQAVLALIQTVVNPNAQRPYDLEHELTR